MMSLTTQWYTLHLCHPGHAARLPRLPRSRFFQRHCFELDPELLYRCHHVVSITRQILRTMMLMGSNWCVMSFTYIRFQKAIKVQGLVREEYLHTVSRFGPWCGYWAFGWAFLFLWVQGYAVFVKGNWSVPTFIFNYGIVSGVVDSSAPS